MIDQTTEATAPDNTESADEQPLLDSEAPAEGAPAEQTETGGDSGGTAPAEGEATQEQPLLTPGVDENGKSELEGAPEAYADYNMPEGFAIDEDTKARVDGIFKELNLSQKGAQRLIDAYTEQVVSQKEADLAALADRRRQWRAEVRKSPTFAADKAFALKGLNAVVTTPEERALFKDSWMSDHPALFSMFVKVGRLVGEDTPLPNGSTEVGGDSAVQRFPIKL
jgi:hypothetical protein